MDSVVTWIIIVAFYAPLHYLVPVLMVLLRSSDAERRGNIISTLIDCTASMLASFALVIWLASEQRITAAMLVLLLSMALPYLRILRRRPDPIEQAVHDHQP
jgi:hypothetical protein